MYIGLVLYLLTLTSIKNVFLSNILPIPTAFLIAYVIKCLQSVYLDLLNLVMGCQYLFSGKYSYSDLKK